MRLDGIEWDENKAAKNIEKHGISFETAQYVYSDPERIERFDRSEKNDTQEERWQTIGKAGYTLLVVHEQREDTRRLVTARLATKKERRLYNGYYQITSEGWTKAE